MRDKDRARLYAAAFVLGVGDRSGKALPANVLNQHDWRNYLLARDMEPADTFTGPDWVPFALWGTRDKETSRKLIFDAGARELWATIAEVYDRPNDVATTLPMELAFAQEQWSLTSKRTPAKHRAHCIELKAKAESLAREIDRIEALEEPSTGERFDFMRLYDDKEKQIVYQNVYVYNLRNGRYVERDSFQTLGEYMAPEDASAPESPLNLSRASKDAGHFWEFLLGDDEEWPGIVPSPTATLRRLANYFQAEAANPALQRPAFENAERNFIARHLCRYFRDSFGFASPAIISRIVCMFHPQGITDNEVSQMIKQLPGGNKPLPDPWLPENCPEK